MRIVVLGGLGLQGQAALVDLTTSPAVTEVVCLDVGTTLPHKLADRPGMSKLSFKTVNASSPEALTDFFRQCEPQAVIDLLPLPLMRNAFQAAIAAKVPLVSTNYVHSLKDLDGPAREAGVTLLPECGLDPGIDLVIIGHAVRTFDRLEVLNSYCGGIPEAKAADNFLKYKISWNWDMVLNTQMRPATFIHRGLRLEVPPEEQHETEMIHRVFYPGLGELEAVPNGNAVAYTDALGLTATIRETGRYSLRWPGWCDTWRIIKRLGFLDDSPVPGLPVPLSPRQFLARMMEPRIQYQPHEKDLAVMLNVFEGIKDNRRKRLTTRLLIERDLATGIMAMSQGVGYTASIAAQMIVRGEITGAGLLSPVTDIPYHSFMAELRNRGITIEDVSEWLD